MGQQIQMVGFYWAGFLCLVSAVLKLTIEGHWSWWRVLLPLGVVFGDNALYITVGFCRSWIFRLALFRRRGRSGRRSHDPQGHRRYAYQLAAMLCFLIFAANLLGRIEGQEEKRRCGSG